MPARTRSEMTKPEWGTRNATLQYGESPDVEVMEGCVEG